MTAPRLAVENLSYGYPGRAVGRDIGFTLGAGEVLCVLGRNGEGKSTLFKTILGLLPPRSGAVRVDGEPISGWSPRRRALIFGYVPQSSGGAFPFTVAELVLMGRIAHRRAFAAPSTADREAADEAIAALGIEHLARREWLRVSGGERQLALVARAMAQNRESWSSTSRQRASILATKCGFSMRFAASPRHMG
jgi:iron complex transport system ATP-binding protein